jgi:mannitol 2-dehydrogenase
VISPADFGRLPDDVGRPTYDRSRLTAGIAHFGIGGFHRSHQAMYLDRLLEAGEATDWAIVGIGLLPSDAGMRDVMRSQDHAYTLVLKHPDGRSEARVIGAIIEYLFAPDRPTAVVERLADPSIRVVSLTVTEGGYNINPATGEFDGSTDAIVHDLADPSNPRTVFGFVIEALRVRRERGVPPFTVLSCDNVAGKGGISPPRLLRVRCAARSGTGRVDSGCGRLPELDGRPNNPADDRR